MAIYSSVLKYFVFRLLPSALDSVTSRGELIACSSATLRCVVFSSIFHRVQIRRTALRMYRTEHRYLAVGARYDSTHFRFTSVAPTSHPVQLRRDFKFSSGHAPLAALQRTEIRVQFRRPWWSDLSVRLAGGRGREEGREGGTDGQPDRGIDGRLDGRSYGRVD